MAEDYVASCLQSVVLEHDLVGNDGVLLAKKGSRVWLSPQVMDKTVITGDGRSLAVCLEEMRKNLAGYQAELIRLASRYAEIQLAELSAEMRRKNEQS